MTRWTKYDEAQRRCNQIVDDFVDAFVEEQSDNISDDLDARYALASSLREGIFRVSADLHRAISEIKEKQ